MQLRWFNPENYRAHYIENAYLRAKSTERKAGVRVQLAKSYWDLESLSPLISETKHPDDFCYIGSYILFYMSKFVLGFFSCEEVQDILP